MWFLSLPLADPLKTYCSLHTLGFFSMHHNAPVFITAHNLYEMLKKLAHISMFLATMACAVCRETCMYMHDVLVYVTLGCTHTHTQAYTHRITHTYILTYHLQLFSEQYLEEVQTTSLSSSSTFRARPVDRKKSRIRLNCFEKHRFFTRLIDLMLGSLNVEIAS
jgi:hypothetical protein